MLATALSILAFDYDLEAAVRELARLNKTLHDENTERERTEHQLRQAERELQRTIDMIPMGVVTFRPDGNADFFNQSWRTYTGLSLEELQGHPRRVTVHPDDIAFIESAWAAHLASGEPYQVEQRERRADGEYRWHLIRRVPLRDEAGNIIKWYGAGYDIEDQKRAEGALRRSQAYLDEAQRLSHTGSFAWRIASGDVVWSKEAYRMLGFERTVQPTIDLVLERTHPEDRALVQHEIDRATQGEQDYDYEHRFLMPDGTVKQLHIRARRIRYESGEEEIVGAVMDVTATRMAQEALHRAQAELAHVTRMTTLGQMSASIAHEVNQPLSGIVANGEAGLQWLSREVPEVDEASQSIRRIVSDANRASAVIRRIREFARKSEPEVRDLDINDVVGEVLPLVKREALSHRVRLQLQLAPGLPPVRGDRVQLQQVIINLVINGLQAMATVTDRVRVLTICTQQQDPDQVLVAVEDVGIGIDPASADRLFSAFYTTKPDGMGIGLSICRAIIEAHGGRVWASRNSGPGMTFRFTVATYRRGG